MKRVNVVFLSAMLMLLSMSIHHSFAQGRGNAYGHQKKSRGHKHHNEYHYREHHDHHVRVVRPVHVHQHHHDCGHTVVVHHYEHPRYVYYSDYDVYYDHHRNVYISYSGRNWTISASLPVVLHRVDIRRARAVEVSYYDDDFVAYLDRGRPMYSRTVVVRH